MSEKPDKDQKVHDPSEQRLRQAVEDGNILRARDVVAGGMLAGGLVVLIVGAPYGFAHLQELSVNLFLAAGTTEITMATAPDLLIMLSLRLLVVLAPLFGVLAVLAIGLNVMQSGLSINKKALVPKFNRVNPVEGFKRIFSMKGLFETFKAIVKLAIVGPMAYVYVKGLVPEILGLHRLAMPDILGMTGKWVAGLSMRLLGALLVLAVIDFIFEKRRRWNELKMTTEEIKKESKDAEGDPQLKGRRRAKARELAMGRPSLVSAVLQADVVVTNPTHYAIALRYDPVAGGAPLVLVKGIRKRALRIKGLALEKGIPTVEDRPLARALYAAVPEGAEIPDTLYAAVAAILAEVYRTRAR